MDLKKKKSCVTYDARLTFLWDGEAYYIILKDQSINPYKVKILPNKLEPSMAAATYLNINNENVSFELQISLEIRLYNTTYRLIKRVEIKGMAMSWPLYKI